MRFNQVLTFDKTKGSTKFNLKNLCQMRDVSTDDVSHLGKIVRYNVMYKNGLTSYKVHFTKWHIIFDKDGMMYIGKYKMDDFNIGFVTLIPPVLFSLIILTNISIKLYIVLGIFLFFYTRKN